jgi:hypothetical protein
MRVVAVLLLLCACAGARQPGSTVMETGDPAITVITTADLRGRTVLDAIALRVPDLHIEQHPSECPHLTLRSTRSLPSTGAVAIYVDGSLARDSCALSKFLPGEVERVEVYPGGVAARPGYPRNEHGFILIFRRNR